MAVAKDTILGWLFVVLGVAAMIPAVIILYLNTDSLDQSNGWLVAVTSGSGILIAATLLLCTGAHILAAGFRHRLPA